MSAVEQIANWERKAVEAQLQLLEHKITVAMRNKPSIVRPLWEKCLALGITDENVKDVEEGFVKSRAAVAKSKQKAQAAAKRAACREAHETDSIPPERTFTLNKVDALRDRVLPPLSPFALSQANLRAAEKKMGGKTGLLQVLEFCCGLTADFVIGGVFSTFGDFIAFATQLSVQRGERASQLRLPPVWSVDGIYSIVCVSEATKSVTIKQNFTGHTAHLNLSDRIWPSFSQQSDLEIVANYSESMAKLHSHRDPTHLYDRSLGLGGYFTTHLVEKSELKRAGDELDEQTPTKMMKRDVMAQLVQPLPFCKAWSAESIVDSSPGSASQSLGEVADGSSEKALADDHMEGDADVKTEVMEGAEKADGADWDESALAPPPPPKEEQC
eukprot:1909998-Amphidinium_carterae.1